jgi:DNA-binding transcriptional MerR regulator
MTISKEDYYLISDVSRLLDVPPHRIVYPLLTRKVPEPQRIGGRRIFSWADIQLIAEQLGRTLPEQGEGSTK